MKGKISFLCTIKGCWKKRWDAERFKLALKFPLALYAASLFIIVPVVSQSVHGKDAALGDKQSFLEVRNAIWIPLTVIFIHGDTTGASLKQSILRLLGTLIGSSFGALVYPLTNNNPFTMTFFLTIWTFFSCLTYINDSIRYSGTVSAFSAAIIMLGFDTSNTRSNMVIGVFNASLNETFLLTHDKYTIQQYALSRMQLNMIGVFIYLVVMNFVFPRSAKSLLLQQLSSSLKMFHDWILCQQNFFLKAGKTNRDPNQGHMDLKIAGCLRNQGQYIQDTQLEPALCHSFNALTYRSVLQSQHDMLGVCKLAGASLTKLIRWEDTKIHPTSLTLLKKKIKPILLSLSESILAVLNCLYEDMTKREKIPCPRLDELTKKFRQFEEEYKLLLLEIWETKHSLCLPLHAFFISQCKLVEYIEELSDNVYEALQRSGWTRKDAPFIEIDDML